MGREGDRCKLSHGGKLRKLPALCYSTSLLLKLHPSTNSSVELRAGWLGDCNLEKFASGVLVLASEAQAAAG